MRSLIVVVIYSLALQLLVNQTAYLVADPEHVCRDDHNLVVTSAAPEQGEPAFVNPNDDSQLITLPRGEQFDFVEIARVLTP